MSILSEADIQLLDTFHGGEFRFYRYTSGLSRLILSISLEDKEIYVSLFGVSEIQAKTSGKFEGFVFSQIKIRELSCLEIEAVNGSFRVICSSINLLKDGVKFH